MMAYRINLIFFVLSNLAYSISGILFVWYLFYSGRVNEIAGFTIYEFYFVMALGQIIQMIGWLLAGKSTWRLRQGIYLGGLDFYLTKPVNTIFLVSFSQFWIAQFGATLVSSLFLLTVSWPHLAINWTAEFIGKLIFILLISLLIYWLIFWLASLVWFFWPQFNSLRYVFDVTSDVSFYPRKVYPAFLNWFFTFIWPMFLVINPIFFWLEGKYDWTMMWRDGGILIIFILIYMIMWREGLKRYNSAN